MIEETVQTQNYLFSTSVSAAPASDEFYVEFFLFTEGTSCQEKPARIVRNFDELVSFLDEMEHS